MIVNIRGTHGSGKSTLVRRVKELYGEGAVANMLSGRKQPYGYTCVSPELRPLYIAGHYVGACGGCDSISSIESIFGSVQIAAESGLSVLFEGIVAQHSAGRLLELNKVHPVTVIVLSTPLEECIRSVNLRRIERGQFEEVDPKNLTKEFKSVLSSTKRLRSEGMVIQEMDREQAFEFVSASLRAPANAA